MLESSIIGEWQNRRTPWKLSRKREKKASPGKHQETHKCCSMSSSSSSSKPVTSNLLFFTSMISLMNPTRNSSPSVGLEGDALSWVGSYISGRSQSVIVDGCMSPPLDIECGVPQGSILGPLMYIIFTNDIPDLVHDHPVSYKDHKAACQACGSTVCYVDVDCKLNAWRK